MADTIVTKSWKLSSKGKAKRKSTARATSRRRVLHAQGTGILSSIAATFAPRIATSSISGLSSDVMSNTAQPAVGIGYRSGMAEWTRSNLDHFDVLEITVDHCIHGGQAQRNEIFDLVGRIPLNAHGVGLSIGTDVPLDLAYVDQVAAIVERLQAPTYSEHLAFTRVPGLDLANLLPLPKTETVAESIVTKVQTIRSRIPVPFLLENISYAFVWPDSDLSDVEFLNLICRESGAGILLDIENLYLNAANHGFNPYGFIDGLTLGLVREVHMAGGIAVKDGSLERPFLADSHSHPIPTEALDLLQYALARHAPETIVLERDDRFDAVDEILSDIARIRACVNQGSKNIYDKAAIGSAG
jgi:uncharacterized protein